MPDECGSLYLEGQWRPFVTEDPSRTYAPDGVSWMYIHDAPTAIIDDGRRVVFWTTPVFDRMWYTACNLGPAAAAKQCTDSVKQNPLFAAAKYVTGLAGKDQVEAAGLQCYGAGCVTDPSTVCGALHPPRIGWAPGKATDVKHSNGRVVAVEWTFISTLVASADDFRSIANLMYNGRDRARFIPRNIGAFLLARYCLLRERDGPRKGDYYIFTRKECAELKNIDNDTYRRVLDTACTGKSLAEEQCRVFCGETNTNCDARIEAYCKGLSPKEALNAQNTEVCGCFMGAQFYSGYFDELKKKFNFPVTAPPSHVCYFDRCASSNVKPYHYKQNPPKCPDVVSCFQSATVIFDGNGQIQTGDININQSQECSIIGRKCKADADCKSERVKTKCSSSNICVDPLAPPPPPQPQPQPPPPPTPPGPTQRCGHWEVLDNGKCVPIKGQCLTNAQCLGSGVCMDNRCVPQTPSVDVGLAILAAVACIGVLVVVR